MKPAEIAEEIGRALMGDRARVVLTLQDIVTVAGRILASRVPRCRVCDKPTDPAVVCYSCRGKRGGVSVSPAKLEGLVKARAVREAKREERAQQEREETVRELAATRARRLGRGQAAAP